MNTNTVSGVDRMARALAILLGVLTFMVAAGLSLIGIGALARCAWWLLVGGWQTIGKVLVL